MTTSITLNKSQQALVDLLVSLPGEGSVDISTSLSVNLNGTELSSMEISRGFYAHGEKCEECGSYKDRKFVSLRVRYSNNRVQKVQIRQGLNGPRHGMPQAPYRPNVARAMQFVKEYVEAMQVVE